MSVPTIVKLQLGLSTARLIVLVVDLVIIVQYITDDYFDDPAVWIVPMGIGYLNDLVLLTLDFVIYGNILVAVIVQHLVSLMLLVFSIASLVIHSAFPPLLNYMSVLVIVSNLPHLILSTRALILNPRGSWVLGIKDVEYYRTGGSIRRPRLSVFGTRRPSDDMVRKIPGHVWAGMKLVIFRRREGIESLGFAVIRNITALLLFLGLVAQTTYLFYQVIDGKSIELREVRDQLPADQVRLDIKDILIVHNGTASPQWFTYTAYGSRNYSWGDLLQPERRCNESFSCFPSGPDSSTHLHIEMVTITDFTVQSQPSPMWISGRPLMDQTQFGGAFEMVPGSYLIGLIDISFRKKIVPSFTDMLGITRQYEIFPLLSIDWVISIPLDNTTIARASLSFNTNLSQQPYGIPYQFKIIRDVRVNTFLGALSSIGGLLAVFQGLHVLCFGMPLFWGLSGAQLLNPFGLFGSGTSSRVRQQMIARYGLIPGNPSNSNVHGLSLFLSEFVLNFGPLSGECDPEAKDIQQAEEGEMAPRVERASHLPFSSGVEEIALLDSTTNQRRSDDMEMEVPVTNICKLVG